MNWENIIEWSLRILSIGILVFGFLREHAKNAKTQRGLKVSQDVMTGAREILRELFPKAAAQSAITAGHKDSEEEKPSENSDVENCNQLQNDAETAEPEQKGFKGICKSVYKLLENEGFTYDEQHLADQIVSALRTGYYYIYKEPIAKPEKKSESAEGVNENDGRGV